VRSGCVARASIFFASTCGASSTVCSKRPTVGGLAGCPAAISRALKVRKLLRTHFWPLIGSPAVSGATTSCNAGTIGGSLFGGRTLSPGPPHPLVGTVGHRGVQVYAPAPDGLFVQSRDLRDQAVAVIFELD
jgi:hypothetical protein